MQRVMRESDRDSVVREESLQIFGKNREIAHA